ncbi:hypothetical protein PCASD_17261 [Puccinia coronata f. sp. avenae]|uniref:Uncharacterized protein n=1 Tax=Puccinia coronata f. sp. avenae TaxID=200324 RepID=A0A2N5U860_9BASI|nr:hypothetical protein PCASD_13885 [Puccinia coronata f. sp. avenae]PLW34317.1 hypothetical protein PCASD_17261 [Puccinia coronata f. sp. avenae]
MGPRSTRRASIQIKLLQVAQVWHLTSSPTQEAAEEEGKRIKAINFSALQSHRITLNSSKRRIESIGFPTCVPETPKVKKAETILLHTQSFTYTSLRLKLPHRTSEQIVARPQNWLTLSLLPYANLQFGLLRRIYVAEQILSRPQYFALSSFRYRLCKEGIISQGHHDESVLKAENHGVHSELSKSSACSSVDSKASLASGEEQLKSNSLETRLACSEESDPTHREAQRVNQEFTQIGVSENEIKKRKKKKKKKQGIRPTSIMINTSSQEERGNEEHIFALDDLEKQNLRQAAGEHHDEIIISIEDIPNMFAAVEKEEEERLKKVYKSIIATAFLPRGIDKQDEIFPGIIKPRLGHAIFWSPTCKLQILNYIFLFQR